MKQGVSNILSVSQFNGLIKEVLANLGIFRVQGEITELRISPNKGLFLTLSDGKANISVGGYAPQVKGVESIEKGMQVIVQGIADVYVPYGKFSLSAHKIEPVGEGSLAIAYQKLKEKLQKDGLFADEHKQALPQFITKVALLTGKKSAAYSDFVKILKEHNVGVEVIYIPVLVQGSDSVASILHALDLVKQHNDVNAIVLTRGGGSLEDLKSFNDKELAEVLFASPTPVIAGVGHEKDESIADFVADIRASTPSQAAYYIVKQNEEFLSQLEAQGDDIQQQLISSLQERTHEIDTMFDTIHNILMHSFEKTKDTVTSLERILQSYDFRSVLKRGFAMIQKDGKEATSIADFTIGDTYQTLLHDGKLTSHVSDINHYLFSHDKKEKKHT